MWRYGDAGDEYPVSDGEVWACGDHVLACGDIHTGAWDTLIDRVGRPDIVYTDPPLSIGNEKAFRTKAGLDNADADFEALIRRIARPIPSCPHVFVQAGDNHVDDVSAWITDELDRPERERWRITYYDENPCWLLYFGIYTGFNADIDGCDDSETPHLVIEEITRQSPAYLVADPCTGNDGLTTRAAVSNGCQFVGLELHPRRLANVVGWLETRGHTAECVGRVPT